MNDRGITYLGKLPVVPFASGCGDDPKAPLDSSVPMNETILATETWYTNMSVSETVVIPPDTFLCCESHEWGGGEPE